MENNYIYEENICDESVPNKPAATKTAMLFITLCAVIPFILSNLISECFSDIANSSTVFIFMGMVDFIPAVAKCILILFFGYSLTRKHNDAVHFFGIYAFGNALSEIVTSILRLILETVFPVNSNISDYSTVQTVLSVVSVITTVFFSCLLYKKIIGGNTITPVSSADHSKIKIQMIKAYVCIFILSIVLFFAVTILSMLFVKDKTLDIFNNVTLFMTNAINAATLLLNFVVLFFFGYKLKKRHVDGLKFASCYYLPQTFTVFWSFLLVAASNQIQHNIAGNTLENVQYALVLSVITLVTSVLTIVVNVLLILIAIKHFFPKQNVEFLVDYEQNIYDGNSPELFSGSETDQIENQNDNTTD